jgi:hypothetical protein
VARLTGNTLLKEDNMGNCTGKPYTSFSKLEEEKDRMTEEYTKELAREAAYEDAPTEKGIYDAGLRLSVYLDTLESFDVPLPYGLIGSAQVKSLPDAQVELFVTLLGLDER